MAIEIGLCVGYIHVGEMEGADISTGHGKGTYYLLRIPLENSLSNLLCTCVAPKLSLTAINKLSLTTMKIQFCSGRRKFSCLENFSLRHWGRGKNRLIIRINKKN